MSEPTHDNHHLLHYRREWTLRPEAESIRDNDSMIAHGLSRAAHKLLHFMNAPVPVPDYHTLLYVANRLPSGLNVVQGVDTYSSLVEEAVARPNVKYIDRQLGLLSVAAIQGQKSYLSEEMLAAKRVIVV